MYKQHDPDVTPLKEEDAYPADPEEGYGWEKLYSEKLCQYYQEEGKLETRVARFHNIYGPLGTYEGGREKAPAAISRKVALANDGDEIEIWGDGLQTRSFTYIDDCVEGIYRIAQSDHWEPLNLGSDRLVTIDQLVDLVSEVEAKAAPLPPREPEASMRVEESAPPIAAEPAPDPGPAPEPAVEHEPEPVLEHEPAAELAQEAEPEPEAESKREETRELRPVAVAAASLPASNSIPA